MPTPTTPEDVTRLLVERVATVPGVAAIALGGSRATGLAGPDADIDLGLLYRADDPIDLVALQAVVDEVDDRVGTTVSPFGGWGPWVDGGAWLSVGGVRADLLYRSIDRYRSVIDAAGRGQVEHDWLQQPAFGFWSHSLLGELHCARPLHDPTGVVAELAAATDPYPTALRVAVTGGLSWAARFAVENARSPVRRGDRFMATGCLVRSLALQCQVLLALNERYPMNDKRTLEIVSALTILPSGFDDLAEQVLAVADLDAALAAGLALCDSVEELLGVHGLLRISPNAAAFQAARGTSGE